MRRTEYASLGALGDHAILAPKDGRGASRDNNRGYDWSMGISLEQAAKMAREGWPEGAKRAKGMLDNISLPPVENVMTATVNDVTGSYVDVGEYVQGVPECMVDFKPDTRQARFVHIIVSGCYAGVLSANSVMERGVAIAAVIDSLESRGVRCSVELLTHQVKDWQLSVQLKAATDPLNLDVLTFAIAHPATFRRLCFAECEQQSENVRKSNELHVGGGYGHVYNIPEAPGCLVFNSMGWREDWSRDAQRKIREIVERFMKGE